MNKNSGKRLRYSLVPALIFLLILWIVAFLQWGLEQDWHEWGILPRTKEGIKGILFSVFLHKNFSHLLANTPPLLILGWFIYYFYKDIANQVMLWVWLISGFLTWLIARPAYHLGASGLIYGLAFFLFFSGLFRKNNRLAAIALVTVLVYGGLVWNMFPVAELVDPTISWEGHLSGAMAGILVAVLLRKKGPQPDPELEDEAEDLSEENSEEHPPITHQLSEHEEKTTAKPD